MGDRKEYLRKWGQENKERNKRIRKERESRNPEIKKLKSKEYHSKNRDKINMEHKQRAFNIRNTFLAMYGNRCRCCGERSTEFLTVEHIQGQIGKKKKDTAYKAYKTALQEYRPDLYEILCMNCNHSRGVYGYCPHELQGQ